MLFSSITFLYYYLPVTLAVYLCVPKKSRNGVLLLASLLFYFWGEPKYCLLMAGAVLIGYLGGRCIERRKVLTGGFVAGILLLLLLFKYADFFLQSLGAWTGAEIPLLSLALPIGISFYSFQIISYLADVSRGEVRAEKNLVDFAAYVMMFPQLIAGPIVRYETIQEQMRSRSAGLSAVGEGSMRFAAGLAKKVLIADLLGELVKKLDGTGGPLVSWVLALAYMLQLYYDFSGYSDMAIGLGRMLGFDFPENFNYPFISKSITEFWRRWHMTLSGWFRDYVYIPLGGSRVSRAKWVRNIMIVWFLSGLWHGASWNFVLWGLYFGVFLFLEKVCLNRLLENLPGFFGHLYALFVVAVSFVIFRLESFSEIGHMLSNMFGLNGGILISSAELYEIKSYGIVLILAVFGATPLPARLAQRLVEHPKMGGFGIVLKLAMPVILLVLATAFLLNSSVHPFLYFRF